MKAFLSILLSIGLCFGQTITAGSVTTAGSTRLSQNPAPAFTPLTLTNVDHVGPSQTNGSPAGSNYFAGFPTISGHPAQGYQGGVYVNQNLIIFNPWQYNVAIPHGTILAYTGGPAGTFGCNGTSGAGQCINNYSWFDMITLDANAKGNTCASNSMVDNNGIIYLIPGADYQTPDFIAINSLGPSAMTTGGGGTTTPISNSANYAWFPSPPGFKKAGVGVGWCTAIFDAVHGKVLYAPTGAGSFTCNSMFLQYDQGGGSFPSWFTSSHFTVYDLVNVDPAACGYLSISFDGAKNAYMLPLNGAPLLVYDTSAAVNSLGSYKKLIMSNLGTGGFPQVTGNGNLALIQSAAGFVGGPTVWNAAGTTQYMYMAPFATCIGCVSQGDQKLQSQVIRVPIATCSPGTPGAQSCSGTETFLDITASTSTWEIFDLAGLSTNAEWAIAGYGSPAIYGPAGGGYANDTLSNQLVLGAFQLTWVNLHNTADPIVGFVADFGSFYARHHVNGSLSDHSTWDLVQRSPFQANGCMGGAYDPVNQLLYTACPGATPTPSGWRLGPL